MATVLLVRHGETAWNRDRRIQGWAPAPLTERGREQARQLADHVAASYEVDRLVASDLRRTKETARHVARATGATATFERGWRERSFGVYQGLTYDELFEGHPEFAVSAVGYAAVEATPEAGESVLDARERVLDAWDALLADLGTDETVAVVTHGGPIRVVVGDLQGLDAVETVLGPGVGNCSVTTVGVEDGEPELGTLCETVPGVDETGQGSIY